MFNNLIESSSHAREFKRRGSFVLFTTGIYAVLFIVAGVASIFAYDARLEDQNLEFVTMLSPTDFQAEPAPARNVAPQRTSNSHSNVATRVSPMAGVNRPEVAPVGTSAAPNKNPPVPESGVWRLGPQNTDPVTPTGDGRGGNKSGTGGGTPGPVVEIGTPPLPPDPPVHKPAPIKSAGVVNGLAISLPKPVYPSPAKMARVGGAVNVQVLIDEAGKVVSAKAVTGNPLLMAAAVQAAFSARFSPTKLGEQPVKVSGLITYNFVLQ